jgi:hypothetical protein
MSGPRRLARWALAGPTAGPLVEEERGRPAGPVTGVSARGYIEEGKTFSNFQTLL